MVETDWVTVTNIPPLSTLEDTLRTLPPSHQNVVEEARLILSTLGRPIGWFLRFPNPTLVQSLLHTWKQLTLPKKTIDNQYPLFPTYKNGLTRSPPANDHTMEHHHETVDLGVNDGKEESEEKKSSFQVGGRQLLIQPYIPVERTNNGTKSQPRQPDPSARFYHPSFVVSILWELDSSVIRVENCSVDTTMEDIQQLFLPYQLRNVDLLLSGGDKTQKQHQLKSLSNVQTIKQGHDNTRSSGNFTPLATHTFLLRMSSPDYARAAIREKQMCYLLGRQIRLTSYPDQLLVPK